MKKYVNIFNSNGLITFLPLSILRSNVFEQAMDCPRRPQWMTWMTRNCHLWVPPANEAHKSRVAQSLEIQNLPAANGVDSYQHSKYRLLPKWWQSMDEYEWMVEWCRMVMHNILATKLTSFKWSKLVDPERHTSIETTTKNQRCFRNLSHCSPVILGPN